MEKSNPDSAKAIFVTEITAVKIAITTNTQLETMTRTSDKNNEEEKQLFMSESPLLKTLSHRVLIVKSIYVL